MKKEAWLGAPGKLKVSDIIKDKLNQLYSPQTQVKITHQADNFIFCLVGF